MLPTLQTSETGGDLRRKKKTIQQMKQKAGQ